jgi:N-terminal or F0 domain of Talin-head FERM
LLVASQLCWIGCSRTPSQPSTHALVFRTISISILIIMALSLKVFLETQGVTKTMRFGQQMSVAEVTKEIQERTGTGGADHGIFVPANEEMEEVGKWLLPDRTLQFYDIHTGVGAEVHVSVVFLSLALPSQHALQTCPAISSLLCGLSNSRTLELRLIHTRTPEWLFCFTVSLFSLVERNSLS